VHNIDVQPIHATPDLPAPSETDVVSRLFASLMKTSLLLLDTSDAFKYGDSDRLFRNAKFEMFFYDSCGHTKYKLWMFRMLALEHAVLCPREAFEYKWNVCFNSKGGLGKNIPNDNLCEIQVKALKECLRSMGSNVTFERARTAAKNIQKLDGIMENISKECRLHAKSTKKTPVDKANDIQLMVNELVNTRFFEFTPGRNMTTFANFIGPFDRVDIVKLHRWLNEKKEEFVLP
jgi:hypothetical protein